MDKLVLMQELRGLPTTTGGNLPGSVILTQQKANLDFNSYATILLGVHIWIWLSLCQDE